MTTILHYSCITLPHGKPVTSSVLAFTRLNITASVTVLLAHVDCKGVDKVICQRLINEVVAFEYINYVYHGIS